MFESEGIISAHTRYWIRFSLILKKATNLKAVNPLQLKPTISKNIIL